LIFSLKNINRNQCVRKVVIRMFVFLLDAIFASYVIIAKNERDRWRELSWREMNNSSIYSELASKSEMLECFFPSPTTSDTDCRLTYFTRQTQIFGHNFQVRSGVWSIWGQNLLAAVAVHIGSHISHITAVLCTI
jgi:hypothetical protein